MRKKFLALFLATAMVICSGCSLNVSDLKNSQNAGDGQENIDSKNASGKQDSTDNGTNSGADAGTNNGESTVPDDKDEIYVKEGPKSVIGTYSNDFEAPDSGIKLNILCDRIFIIEPGYEALQESLDEVYQQFYDNTLGRWNYDSFIDFGGNNVWYDEWEMPADWDDIAEMYVSRNDEQVYGVSIWRYSYLGGAHPYDYLSSIHYDPATGEIIEFEDVITDKDKLCEEVIEYLTKLNNGTLEGEHAGESVGCLYDNWEEFVRELFADQENTPNWRLMEDGIEIYFNGYAVAPWTEGIISTYFTIDEYPELFEDKYFHKKGNIIPAETYEAYQSDVMKEVLRPLSRKLGNWKYDDCKDFVIDKRFDYEFEEPYEAESSGYVKVIDAETRCRLICYFWPLDPESEVYSKETDSLYFIDYSNSDFTFMIDNDYNSADVRYRFVSYDDYMYVNFSEDEFWLFMSYMFKEK